MLLSTLRFRFSEKKRPDDYATWVSEHMSWPVPPELSIAGPQLTWEWGNQDLEEKTIRSYLESFRVNGGRVVLMAKKEDHERVNPGEEWQTEPWYGTHYRVKRWDQEFVEKVCFIHSELFTHTADLPRLMARTHCPSFIFLRPMSLCPLTLMLTNGMLKKWVKTLPSRGFMHLTHLADPQTASSHSSNPTINSLAQER